MGRKPLDFSSLEQRADYVRALKTKWDAQNPDRLAMYKRRVALKRCIDRGSLPAPSTVHRYGFTKEELQEVFARYLIILDREDTQSI